MYVAVVVVMGEGIFSQRFNSKEVAEKYIRWVKDAVPGGLVPLAHVFEDKVDR